MDNQEVNVLLVEDDVSDAELVMAALRRAAETRFSVDHTSTMADALTALKNRQYMAIILDLSLPDAHGIDTLLRVTEEAPNAPVIVMTGHDNLATAIMCMHHGAQDYQIKSSIGARSLEYSLRSSIARVQRESRGRKMLTNHINDSLLPDKSISFNDLLTSLTGSMQSAVDEVVAYTSVNAPHTMSDIEAILAKHQLRDILREVRRLLARTDSDAPTIPPIRSAGVPTIPPNSRVPMDEIEIVIADLNETE